MDLLLKTIITLNETLTTLESESLSTLALDELITDLNLCLDQLTKGLFHLNE
jgi:hypothetical protein